MELIYTNDNLVEQGVIKDFEIDYAYGKDENDFEIKTPEIELEQGYYWHIPENDYGGVVDVIEATNEYECTYRGRSWQGILNSYAILDVDEIRTNITITQDGLKVTVKGNLKDILVYLTDETEIYVSDTTTTDEVDITLDANMYMYDFIREIASSINCKVRMYYENETIYLEVISAIDYTQGGYFATDKFKVKYTTDVKIPNHFIGVNKTDDQVFIKHIYTDEQGNVQPYYQLDTTSNSTIKVSHEKPLYNGEYERVNSGKVVTGLKEITEVVEGGSSVENYDFVTELQGVDADHPYGTSGNTPFINGVPHDWNDKYYENYYSRKVDENGNITFELLEKKTDYQAYTPSSTAEWEKEWPQYFKRELDQETGEYKYTQLSEDDVQDEGDWSASINHEDGVTLPEPDWWQTNFTDAYWREWRNNQWVYHQVEGFDNVVYTKQNKNHKPTRWEQEKGDYYFKWMKYQWYVVPQIKKGKKWTRNKRSKPFWVKDSLNNYKVGNYTLWRLLQKNNKGITTNFKGIKYAYYGSVRFEVHEKVTYVNKWISASDYCSESNGKVKLEDIGWNDHQWYLRSTTKKLAPDWYQSEGDNGDYFLKYHSYTYPDPTQTYYKEIVLVPTFSGFVYRKVYDKYTNLCEDILKKLDEYKDKATKVEANIDTDIQYFDVGDIIGGVHPITKQQMTSKISKKIVKGNSFKLDVSYEIG